MGTRRAKLVFKIQHKFKVIKVANRLSFLRAHLMRNKPDIPTNEALQGRRGFNYSKGFQFPISKSEIKCYVCGAVAVVRHHVVPLLKGGRNKRNNIVPLCHSCHCKVHPHMQKGYKSKRKLELKLNNKPALCKPKQEIVVIPPKILNGIKKV